MNYSVRMMKTINRIWFDGDWLYGLGDDGKTYRQSLLWYSHLRNASESQRANYEISTIGIHWHELDEDVSFESFLYADAEPTRLPKLMSVALQRNTVLMLRFSEVTLMVSKLLLRSGNKRSCDV